MAKQKGKAVKAAVKKNIRALTISLFAVLLIMLGIPMGVNALDQQVATSKEPTLIWEADEALNISNARVHPFVDGFVDYFPKSISGEEYNYLVFLETYNISNHPATPMALAFNVSEVDWTKVTKLVFRTNDYANSSLTITFNPPGSIPYRLIPNAPAVDGEVVIDYNMIQRLQNNQASTGILYMYFSASDVPEQINYRESGDILEFSIELYGIEDPIVPMNMLPEYVALFAGIGLCGAALFATPWLQVSDVSAGVKKASRAVTKKRPKKAAKKKGGKK